MFLQTVCIRIHIYLLVMPEDCRICWSGFDTKVVKMSSIWCHLLTLHCKLSIPTSTTSTGMHMHTSRVIVTNGHEIIDLEHNIRLVSSILHTYMHTYVKGWGKRWYFWCYLSFLRYSTGESSMIIEFISWRSCPKISSCRVTMSFFVPKDPPPQFCRVSRVISGKF